MGDLPGGGGGFDGDLGGGGPGGGGPSTGLVDNYCTTSNFIGFGERPTATNPKQGILYVSPYSYLDSFVDYNYSKFDAADQWDYKYGFAAIKNGPSHFHGTCSPSWPSGCKCDAQGNIFPTVTENPANFTPTIQNFLLGWNNGNMYLTGTDKTKSRFWHRKFCFIKDKYLSVIGTVINTSGDLYRVVPNAKIFNTSCGATASSSGGVGGYYSTDYDSFPLYVAGRDTLIMKYNGSNGKLDTF